MSLTKTALTALVVSASFYALLCYTIGTPGQPTITLTVTSPEPTTPEVFNLPPLLALVPVDPQFTYSLPGDSNLYGLNACSDFEVLPVSDRTVFVLDAAEDGGIDTLNPCVRDVAGTASTLVVEQCKAGTPLVRAFNSAVRYFHLQCDFRVPQWDLEPAIPHTEFLEEWF